MTMIKIKVCGMREIENIEAVDSLGVDLMGFIFYKKSPRALLPLTLNKEALDIINGSLAAKKVGVFVDNAIDEITEMVSLLKLDYVQLHGNQTPEDARQIKSALAQKGFAEVKIIKALSVAEEQDIKRGYQYERVADMLLFDTKGEKVGGNGVRFDWSLLGLYNGQLPFLLSGGIALSDYKEILNFSHKRFVGVDLNSCFELKPGLKDIEKLRDFIDKIKE